MNNTRNVRTRYAPSPTGFFHIGGARTALFNYLFARHHNGQFIVRIEDTDIERNVSGGVDSQLNSLDWLHLTPDESPRTPGKFPPYIQTEKLKRYQELAHQLLGEHKAYYCFCSKEELEHQREEALKNGHTPKYNRSCAHLSAQEVQNKLDNKIPGVIRLKMPDNIDIKWHDLIRGDMSVPTSALTDPVILKSNGIPMYNFAVVVDDYDMDITHVLRGEEHISNTPYQIAIKQALKFDIKPIEYGHLSIIVDDTGKKLSKRNLELKQFVEDYKKMGFVPEAIVNFLALLGWSAKSNQEIMSLSELEKTFDIDRVSKAPAYFDFKKMLWISNSYIKRMDEQAYLQFVKPFITIDLNSFNNKIDELLLIFKSQLSYAEEINKLITDTFLSTDFNQLSPEMHSIVKSDASQKNLAALKQILTALHEELNMINSNEVVNQVKIQTGLTGKDLYFPIRFAAIGKEHGPEMNKILSVVGKARVLENIDILTRIK